MTPCPAARVTVPRRTVTRPSQDGSLSLELALAVPLLAICLVALLQTVGVVRDLLVVQEAARVGARVAATTGDDGRVRAAIQDSVGGRPAAITVVPAARRPGDTVTVEVAVDSHLGPVTVTVHGRAVTRGEPVLAGAS